MRYIRTKDGKIFDTEYEPKAFKYNWNAKFIIDDNNLIIYDKLFRERIANHGEIFKQADTIEELCDEFVCVQKESDNKTVHKSYWFAMAMKEECKQIYGTIWTDKGLIYVAKMNEEGELELI